MGKDYFDLPEIECSKVVPLWMSGYWDGPLSGMALFNDGYVWLSACDEEVLENEDARYTWWRRFTVLRLYQGQIGYLEERHRCFTKFVCNEDGKYRPESEWHKYYDVYHNDAGIDFSLNEKIGWCADPWNKAN